MDNEIKIGNYYYDLTAWIRQSEQFRQFVWDNEFVEADKIMSTDQAVEYANYMQSRAVRAWDEYHTR